MWEYVFEPEVIKSPPLQVNGHAESIEGNANKENFKYSFKRKKIYFISQLTMIL